ncbi:hypothetical protein VTK56DRAFT_3406 [Thermocarpiscus australiensis]
MAPADSLSPPGSSSYSSDTMSVGDGTWDFTKNTFLLPNLVGLNFETMRYNGMGNRFSTLTQYHTLILGHGVLAAITFLFIVPLAVLLARYYTRRPGSALRYHAYLQILAVGLTTVVFVLGFFAVGPPRNLTNPHHGIGVAIYVLILLQAVGGRLVRKLVGRHSFRMHLHRWFGRAIALLGVVQIPLGLTVYGSPKPLFILYAVWMGFLLLLYFILDYRDYGRREWDVGGGGAESSRVTETTAKSGGKLKWLGPLAAGAGAVALLRGRRKNRDAERAFSRTPSPVDRSHHPRTPEVVSTRRGSESYYDEKPGDRRRASRGGFMNKLFAAGAGLGAGALVGKMMSRRRDRGNDDEYSAVATDTPSRVRRPGARSDFTESEYTEQTDFTPRHPGRHERQSSILPAPRPGAVAGRPPARPMTPYRSQAGTSALDSAMDASDYSSYVSPSRRGPERLKSSGAGKGLLGALGLGFLAKMAKDRRDRREEERLRDEEDRRREEEEERRAGRRTSKYTGDGYPSPSRRASRRRPPRPRPPPSGVTMTTTASALSEESSIEPRGDTPYEPAPPGLRAPPAPIAVPGAPSAPGTNPSELPAAPPAPMPAPIPPGGASMQRSRVDVTEPVSMPPIPTDPNQVLPHEAATREEEERRRRGERARDQSPQTPPVSVRVRVHDDRDRNITLRMLTEEEARLEQQRRRRNGSVSSHSGGDNTPTMTSSRRYRRDSSSQRRAEAAAEHRVELHELHGDGDDDEPLAPPNPAFAAGARRAAAAHPGNKDSAYYSGGQPAGPSGGVPAAGATVSSLGSPPPPPGGYGSPGGSHATFTSGPVTDSAAERRRRRRLERREGSRTATTVDFQ